MEEWKVIPSIPNYEASSLGNIRHIKHKRVLKAWKNTRGYLEVSIHSTTGKNKKVHLLVAEAFLGDCPYNHEVHHKDENKENASVDNLEYVTHQQNCAKYVVSKIRK